MFLHDTRILWSFSISLTLKYGLMLFFLELFRCNVCQVLKIRKQASMIEKGHSQAAKYMRTEIEGHERREGKNKDFEEASSHQVIRCLPCFRAPSMVFVQWLLTPALSRNKIL